VLGVRGEVRVDRHGHARLPVAHTRIIRWRRLLRREARERSEMVARGTDIDKQQSAGS
jgi:hypothetical protein